MLRAERASLQQQLQSLTEELEAAQAKSPEAMAKPEDVSKELALINCFKEVALKHRAKLFDGKSSKDHEVVAAHVPELLVQTAPVAPALELEVEECF
eukprot:symbB.v1.2.003908.t1/scaffold199.1/size273374/13